MINRFNWLLSLIVLVGITSACDDDDDEDLIGNWVSIGAFEGIPRTDAVVFVVGDNAYLGTGYNGTEDEWYKDFWKFDPSTESWSQVANFPGVARQAAVGFAAAGKGYVGTGTDGSSDDNGTVKFKDFYQYDPTANTWSKIADFAGSARYGAVAFGIDDYGYVGTGYDSNNLKDFYRYDPSTDTWTQIPSIPGSKRKDATAFVINGKGYVVTGSDANTNVKDFYSYDPSTDSWTTLRKIYNSSDDSYDDDYNIVSSNAASFTLGQYAYITTGSSSGTASVLTWRYDPIDDVWKQKSDFEGSSRINGLGFTVGGKAYVATGNSSGYYLDDVWRFDPDADQEDND